MRQNKYQRQHRAEKVRIVGTPVRIKAGKPQPVKRWPFRPPISYRPEDDDSYLDALYKAY